MKKVSELTLEEFKEFTDVNDLYDELYDQAYGQESAYVEDIMDCFVTNGSYDVNFSIGGNSYGYIYPYSTSQPALLWDIVNDLYDIHNNYGFIQGELFNLLERINKKFPEYYDFCMWSDISSENFERLDKWVCDGIQKILDNVCDDLTDILKYAEENYCEYAYEIDDFGGYADYVVDDDFNMYEPGDYFEEESGTLTRLTPMQVTTEEVYDLNESHTVTRYFCNGKFFDTREEMENEYKRTHIEQ